MPRSTLALFPLVLSLACAGGGSADATVAEVRRSTILSAVDVATVALAPIGSGPRISGTLQPAERAILRAEAGGTVTEVRAELGDRVAPGVLLARIENRGVQSSFASARSGTASAEQDLANARRDLERSRKLAAAGAVSARDLEVAEASIAASEARVAQARAGAAAAGEQLDSVNVKSPIDGVVSQRAISVGDIVAPGSALFTVIDPTTLRLEASVPADSISLVRPGVIVRFEVQGMTGAPIEGVIDRVSPAVDPVTRQLPILVSVPNAAGTLVAGLFAEGRVSAAVHDGLLVPMDGVEVTADGATALRVRDGLVERVAVVLGVGDPDRELVEVTSGLSAGDQVILGAARDMDVGTSVEIRAGS